MRLTSIIKSILPILIGFVTRLLREVCWKTILRRGGVEKTIAELERIDKCRVALVHAIQDYMRQEPVERAWLFGSFSRMEESPGSDIDILVDLDSSSPMGLLHYARMINTLESLLNRKIDLVTNGSVKPFAIESINRDKVLIYERA